MCNTLLVQSSTLLSLLSDGRRVVGLNLLPVRQMTTKGLNVVFTSKGCDIYQDEKFNITDQVKAHADCSDGLYKLEANGCKYLANAVYIDQEELWHKRLAHLNRRSMALLKNKMATGIEYNGERNPCVPCINGKHTRTPFNKSKKGTCASKVLELIHSDLCGPVGESHSGARYLLTFIGDFTRKTFGYYVIVVAMSLFTNEEMVIIAIALDEDEEDQCKVKKAQMGS
ncbi:hypothetical protein ILUMI_00956 [Ignelater luminosus]|uniref:GAG-pre-integrase domain-containing protein n=1 Tax=Ignelater luminosus TaxID=2038154 RepID=A0A8K0GKR1_IGNLU|nr:hypothetical protein ILUMI_00956 [Ignelater luminosus]